MTQTTEIRRLSDGSIDFDFYRIGATALRRQAMQDGKTLRQAGGGILTTAAVLAVAVWISSMPPISPNSSVAVAQAATLQSR